MTLAYMLDTDTVSYALRGMGDVGRRLLEHPPSALCISSITLAELRFGAAKRKSRRLHALIDTFIASVKPAPFEQAAATAYGTLAASLAVEGTPIGQLDTMIAAHALALGLTLVTNNTRHFAHVSGLRLDNWS